ncbi:unnamed protein product [Effrenium voratum]|nr:unnamed protein product [Effrenium voratum]
MHYLKQSMRCWKGLRQKDANFSMDDALSIAAAGSSALPPITRCFGRAGTVILFAGQGLHRASHSQFAQRRVVTFRFKRNIPHLARLYPLDLVRKDHLPKPDSWAASVLLRGGGESWPGKGEEECIILTADRCAPIQLQQDTSPQETAKSREDWVSNGQQVFSLGCKT